MKIFFISAFMMSIFATGKSDTITGRWQTKPSPTGSVTGVVFKADNTFEGYVNKKPFVSGRYSFYETILSFTDNGCNGAQGTYKTVFFSNGDSLRFELMSDTCKDRANGMQRLVLGRIK